MSLNFPDTPYINQVFSAAGKAWVWDGEKWGTGSLDVSGEDFLVVNATVFLPAGFDGIASVANTTGAGLTVTLPPSPNPGQGVLVKDTVGNATTYSITVAGGGANIEGQSTVTISFNYGWLDLIYAGSQWVQT